MKKRHILVVDEDKTNSKGLRQHLKSQGFRVTLAENCCEGRQILGGKSAVDLIILDQKLPDGTGTDLLHSLTKNEDLQKPPVILSSSLMDFDPPSWDELTERLAPATQSLIQAYVPKPYSFDNMDTVVELIFEASPPELFNSKTALSGDYRPASKRPTI